MQKIGKLIGDRIALRLVEEDTTGLQVIKATEQRMYCMSEVLAIGDGVKHIKVGDKLLWQWIAQMQWRNQYTLNDKEIFILQESDMIARLTQRKVTLNTFEILGDWCLVEKVMPTKVGRIHLPGNVESNNPAITRYFMRQMGAKAAEALAGVLIGDELFVDRSRANPLEIQGVPYVYVQSVHILGAYTPDKKVITER